MSNDKLADLEQLAQQLDEHRAYLARRNLHAQCMAEAAAVLRSFAAEKQAEPSADRQMLLSVMQELDGSVWNCERCGHAEDTKTMDVAERLRRYIAAEKQAGPVACISAKPDAKRPHRPDDFCPDQRCGLIGQCFRVQVSAAPPSESDKEDAELPSPDLRGIDAATASEWSTLRIPANELLVRVKDLPEIILRAARAKKEQQ